MIIRHENKKIIIELDDIENIDRIEHRIRENGKKDNIWIEIIKNK